MSAREQILSARTSLGIELGSTRIKACLIGDDGAVVLATGSHEWQSVLEGGHWSYSLEEIERGLQSAYAGLVEEVQARYGVRPERYGAIGVSAMMHGYLAFDRAGELLVPFRTWRDTTTGEAAAELTELFGMNIPLRWSIAHLHQAVRDAEPHLERLASITTLAGYVHRRLTGSSVLGIGDASGMLPIDSSTGDYDARVLAAYDGLAAGRLPVSLRELLPQVLPAGAHAGSLTGEGAVYLDPSGALRPGAPMCPPEGDAGTGMVATGSVSPRTGNVSAGTSIFAMVVLEQPLRGVHHEIDLVTTPAGDPVAMVHCNNGASELAAWAGLFMRFAEAIGHPVDSDAAYRALFGEALIGSEDAGGLVSFNYLAGEPIVGLDEGRPLVVRPPDSELTLANFMRSQLYGVFATLALGMQVLEAQGAALDRMFAHGGMFRTPGVAQRLLAGALATPVAVGGLAAEGGAWGIAVLAAYLRYADSHSLAEYLDSRVLGGGGALGDAAPAALVIAAPEPADVAGFTSYLDRYRVALDIESAAVASLALLSH